MANKLDRDGKLAIPEAAVERTITEFLAAEGWVILGTKAEARMPTGAPAHRSGTLDALAVRIHRHKPQVLFCEFKRRHARTGKKHLAEQVAMVNWLRERDFAVFRNSEAGNDPIGEFRTFYREWFR